MSGHAPTADEDLRVIALAAALECEGPKALTGRGAGRGGGDLSLPERAARRRHGQRQGALMVACFGRIRGVRGHVLLAAMHQAYQRPSYCSTARAWLKPGRDQFQ
jgi:hypothetical protein